jgi:hypothetical protein
MTKLATAADQIDLLLAAAVDRDEVPGVAALAADTNGVTNCEAFGVICTQILPFADPQVLALFDQFENAARTL